ncbi:HPP family protein [Actinomycetospora soli]|uniref:HPP family protein n=1 Tax=Actinomycetospora soli TaxID=2893887 RepID=UPI001E41F1DA|nr:HPP family protein [Actinomycetospora soli]MCD2188130.1 HPP family protein [Actinomycetospora soli]
MTGSGTTRLDLSRRLLLGVRLALLAGALVAAVGLAGWFARDTALGGTWLTTTLGPTAYVVIAHPRSAMSRLRNGVIGHATAIVVGLGSFGAFGLWHAPSVAEIHVESPTRVGAQAVALALTLLVLTLARAHHAPAGATALLISSGIAAPGAPLFGLVVGLAIVLAAAPVLARLPVERDDTADLVGPETPMG